MRRPNATGLNPRSETHKIFVSVLSSLTFSAPLSFQRLPNKYHQTCICSSVDNFTSNIPNPRFFFNIYILVHHPIAGSLDTRLWQSCPQVLAATKMQLFCKSFEQAFLTFLLVPDPHLVQSDFSFHRFTYSPRQSP